MGMPISRRSSKAEPVPDACVDHIASDLVPRRTTLDGFATEAADTEGIDVREAEPLVPLLVATQNSLYRVIPLRLGGSDVLVQGGQFFPEPTKARLVGSTFGGSFLKMHWINIGMHMEIDAGGEEGPIITTRVANVSVERDRKTSTRPH
jgi:hypothetical protein